MDNTKLCIDGRAASDFSAYGLLAEELVDQLVAWNAEHPTSDQKIHLENTILISLPSQDTPGPMETIKTRLHTSRTPLHWLWEKNIIKKTEIQTFHRFRPADSLPPKHPCSTVTTLLPPQWGMPLSIAKSDHHRFVVPSRKDALLLQAKYGTPEKHITIMVPGIRRQVQMKNPTDEKGRGWVLFLIGQSRNVPQLNRLVNVIEDRFPMLPRKKLSLKQRNSFSPESWLRILQHTKLCFYLCASPFDWGTLFLESVFWNIPTVFCDQHSAISELLPNSMLRLNRFLINQPDLTLLKEYTEAARSELIRKGVMDPYSLVRQYQKLYAGLSKGSH